MPDPAKQNPQTPDRGDAVRSVAERELLPLAGWDRRTFLKQGAFAAGTALFNLRKGPFGLGARHGPGGTVAHKTHGRTAQAASPPNILTIMVDQLRTPVWMPGAYELPSVMPNLAALRAQSVSFERHYTASNDCSPSRSVLLTGLYTHQTGVMITGAGWLVPGFPTWGTLLRKMGYSTAYYGKWHLNPNEYTSLAQYGFAGGTYPSPNGNPGQGTTRDPFIADQFIEWFAGHAGKEPWATTVSFVNPHDLAFWYKFTEKIATESSPPGRAQALPPNFETQEQLAQKGKPLLQRSLQDTMAEEFGAVPWEGNEVQAWWTQMMDTYLLLQTYVDEQIGRIFAALASKPEVAANTVIIFTSDHGEYCGSHGMRGKGASPYEEALRVPLYVYDPRNLVTAATQTPRTGLTSHADIVGLMLTIASGSNKWRNETEYAHLAGRHDLASMCANPAAPGRKWIVHATDEDLTEFSSTAYSADAPRHMVAIRTPKGKLALYRNWLTGTTEVAPLGQEVEFYDYSTEEGRLELSAQTPGVGSPLREELWSTLEEEAIPQELQAPLPSRLHTAHRRGLKAYYTFEERQAAKLAEMHPPEAIETAPEGL